MQALIKYLREIGFIGNDEDLRIIAKLPIYIIIAQAREIAGDSFDENETREILLHLKRAIIER